MIRKASLLLVLVYFAVAYDDEYYSLGCYEDSPDSRAISGKYIQFATGTVELCFRMAKRNGFEVFAIEEQTHCYSSATSYQTYHKYGHSDYCRSGRGGFLALDVYQLRPTGSFLLIKMHMMANEAARKQGEIDELKKIVQGKESKIHILTEELRRMKANVSHQLKNLNKNMDNAIGNVSKNVSHQLKNVDMKIDIDMYHVNHSIERIYKNVSQQLKNVDMKIDNDINHVNHSIERIHKNVSQQLKNVDMKIDNDINHVNHSIERIYKDVWQQLKNVDMKIDNDINHVNHSIERIYKNVSHQFQMVNVKIVNDTNRIRELQHVHNSDIQEIKKNESDITNDIKRTLVRFQPRGAFFFPEGTTDLLAFKVYPAYGVKFVGFMYLSCNGKGWFVALSVVECVQICNTYYVNDKSYKDMEYITNNQCFCCNKDVSRQHQKTSLAYQFD